MNQDDLSELPCEFEAEPVSLLGESLLPCSQGSD
jgi:hypothetical protein